MDPMDASLPPKERLKKLFGQGHASIQNNVPISRYFRSGQEMIRMSKIYCQEKQYESAYILLAKFITLFLEKLKSHPQFKHALPNEKSANKKSLKFAMDQAENVKSILEEQYTIEHAKWKKEAAKLKLLEAERLEQERLNEKHRNEMAEKAKLCQEEAQMDYFVEQMNRKRLERERQEVEAKFSGITTQEDSSTLIPIDIAGAPPVKNLSTSIPHIDRSSKPKLPETTSAAATTVPLSNKYGLRTVVSPHDLPQQFMVTVKVNTDRNIETCGVLFGNLSQNKFVITHVLIPHQTGTPNSCNTTREEDLWEFQEHCDGICLGWIHTHPSQTAFLSSVDLHTHYPYQCLMTESVAIVCSGKFNEIGYFMISPGQGMNEIGGCSKTGHHPHRTVPPLFESCDHVHVSTSHSIIIVDWRNK